ncbi:MAG: hypothetical protein R3E97_11620 [Candidatus Eisenbacteria bacterium]
MKDASGTTGPEHLLRDGEADPKIIPPEMPPGSTRTHIALMAVSCYMAGIDGGVDGIDLSVRLMASGTVQPDVRSMAHAAKGTGSISISTSR